jgi:hypothetical protein
VPKKKKKEKKNINLIIMQSKIIMLGQITISFAKTWTTPMSGKNNF